MTDAGAAIDVVLFDLDDTLYSTTAFARKARRDAVAAMVREGLGVSEDDGFNELCEVVAEFTSNYDQHFGRLLDRLGPVRPIIAKLLLWKSNQESLQVIEPTGPNRSRSVQEFDIVAAFGTFLLAFGITSVGKFSAKFGASDSIVPLLVAPLFVVII